MLKTGRQRSDRLIAIGVVLYMFGLSCRYVEKFLPLIGCKGSKSSIERDVADAGQKIKALHFAAPRMRIRILGVDGTGARMAGKNAGMLFFVDIDPAPFFYSFFNISKVRGRGAKADLR